MFPYKKLAIVLGSQNRKSIARIVCELVRIAFRYRVLPVHYFSRYLHIKGMDNIFDFVPNHIVYSLWPKFNEMGFIPLLDNKLLFYHYFKALRINTIDILAHNHGHKFMSDGETMHISSVDHFLKIIDEMILRSCTRSIYIKQCYNSYGGQGIFRIDENDLNNRDYLRKEVFDKIVRSSFIFQETVCPHHDLIKINPDCLSSLRIDTFLNSDGSADVISAFLRYGTNGSIVDNTSSGGGQVGINLETGLLDKYGYATLSDGKGMVHEFHPDTKIEFEGYGIPFFKESLELVKEAAVGIPGLRLVGWDVAVLENGPVLIEGNHDYDMTGTDLALGGCFKSPVFRNILIEAGIRVPGQYLQL